VAVNKTKSVDWAAPRLKGKTFAFTGRLIFKKQVLAWIKREGGKHVSNVTDKVDYLVVGEKRGKAPTGEEQKAARLNQKGAHIQSIDEEGFVQLLELSVEEAVAMLRAGPKGCKRWELFQQEWAEYVRSAWHRIDAPVPRLKGVDLRNVKLDGVHLANLIEVRLDGASLQKAIIAKTQGCSFKKANLAGASLTDSKNCKLDGALLRGCAKLTLADCSLVKADLSEMYNYETVLLRCDLTGARLVKAHLNKLQAKSAKLTGTDMQDANFFKGKLAGADFGGARLTGACLARTDLKSAVFAKANLRGADLTEADLSGADLTGADLCDACLAGANLKGAIIDGANFTGGYLYAARLDGLDPSSAKGLDPKATGTRGTVGPCMAELEKTIRKDDWLDTSATVKFPFGQVTFEVTRYRVDSTSFCTSAKQWHEFDMGRNFPNTMRERTELWTGGTLCVESVSASTRRGKVPKDRLDALTRAAWCELFGVAPPSSESLEDQHEGLRRQMLAELRGGPKGVRKWILRPDTQHVHLAALRPLKLAGAKLRDVRFDKACLADADFSNADMVDAWITMCDCSHANYTGANLKSTLLHFSKFTSASFDTATLMETNLHESDLRDASIRNADLTDAELDGADLRGADLTGAKIARVTWQRVQYDEKTRFPKGFVPTRDMRWQGQGPPPGLPGTPGKAIDYDGLLERLHRYLDFDRLNRALKMLRADRFQLFADVKDDSIVGVVKSQTDADLVYSCRLTGAGDFSCCTQNLNVCGGLRGGLCKHLLVLIVGLARTGKLDSTKADAWANASRSKKPVLDKDVMSDTFLRYKGAEAGEIDWRPTETIPEDFYAM
jgi:uncharacterized protein YjbI with pentapeptide repeats